MPLLNIHIVEGRRPEDVAELQQVIHEAMVEAFQVPVRDRYQIVTEHVSSHLVMEDTGLGFERTEQRVLIHMTTRPRSQEMKQAFYQLVTRGLAERCGVPPQDVMFSVIENSDADWSFGFGKAQFVTGDL
ncbi:tautomerase family protein [Granulibacter bethesdensis]|uniref:tautomerase family protein n=1 Tax=Granulibacter bethesdensis TaxID=364410 RepID=UPI00090A3D3A|nr:tautomerase family protein [Granulibacter bethesdensis]APH61775.1 Tautomerase family protein [Granulibacter bethesdensis]